METQNVSFILGITILSIIFLMLAIIRYKIQPFVALLLTSILAGLAFGVPMNELLSFITKSMGDSLGSIAIVIGLGAMFGEMLHRSGASERLALRLIEECPEKYIPWALGLTGFLVSIAVFIDVAIVILVPLTYGIARRTGRSLLYYAIPLTAGLSVTHTFVPPTPGPIATASIMNADLGLVILFGIIAGLPAMAVAGPLWGKFIAKRIYIAPPEPNEDEKKLVLTTLPKFKWVIFFLLLPIVLILANTSAAILMTKESTIKELIVFIGNPVIALLITMLLTFWFFGYKRGFSSSDLQVIATKALEPAGIIILITGAGGVFGKLLVETGVGQILANNMQDYNFPLILFAFLSSAIIRVIQGSGTVAMITGATLTAPIAETMMVSPSLTAILCIAIASGGAFASHVNDSGFWMANRYFGASVTDTLKSWTVMKSMVGLTGLGMCFIINAFI